MHLLIVEDEQDQRRVIKRYSQLSQLPVELWEASTLQEAEDILGRVAVSMVIADYRLGHENGWEWLQQLRTRAPHLRLYCLSGERLPASDGIEHLAKPLAMSTFQALFS